MESIFSALLGVLIAWTILMYFPVRRAKVSYYTLNPWPLELDNSNLALVGVGLASPNPKTSVMDTSPASSAQPVMMSPTPMPVVFGPVSTSPSPMPVSSTPMPMSSGPVSVSSTPMPMSSGPVSMSPSPIPVISGPVSMSPGPVTQGPVPSA